MPTPEVDVAVIGAGPAGVAAALGLASHGLRVTVIDPGAPPASRVESLPANGLELAESLGLAGAFACAGLGRAGAMRMLWRAQAETRDFGADGPLLLDKPSLHASLQGLLSPHTLLAARVQRIESGKDHLHLHHKSGSVTARFVIDARGRHSPRAPLGQTGTVALPFTASLGAETLQPVMLLEALEAGWLWASLLPDDRLSGALFLQPTAVAGLSAGGRDALLRRHLAGSSLGVPPELKSGIVAPAALHQRADPFAHPCHLRIGDAALARDPIASHGLVHALRSGAQAATVAATILDPSGKHDAARAFIQDRHREAAGAALTATARAYADQARFRSAFWNHRALPQVAAPPYPNLTRPLGLAPVQRAAALQGNRITWADAIWLPRSRRAATRFGPVSARQLATLIGPPAPMVALAARLGQAMKPALADAILRELLDEGALTEHVPGQACAPASNSA